MLDEDVDGFGMPAKPQCDLSVAPPSFVLCLVDPSGIMTQVGFRDTLRVVDKRGNRDRLNDGPLL